MSLGSVRMLAWEVTGQCNLDCAHCRASAVHEPPEGQLSTREGEALLRDVASVAEPVVILSGGEPLMRPDIFDIAWLGKELGLRMVMAVNGTLLDDSVARKLKQVGIQRISVSLDGANRQTHDGLRGVKGAFRGALDGIKAAKGSAIPFQINTTVTKRNLKELPKIMELAVDLGAVAHHIFLLVPTGRGESMAEEAISPEQYEQTLHWFYDQRSRVPIQLKATCAPHYYRIMRQRARQEGRSVTVKEFGLDATTRGCMAGQSFCFVSFDGDVKPCGYLDLVCGNVRERQLSWIWENSEILKDLRDLDRYKGKCGRCEYRSVCGGCRARAYALTGDYMEEEPFCIYQPKRGAQT